MPRVVAASVLAFAGVTAMLASNVAFGRITKIVIDEKVSPAFCKGSDCAKFGEAGAYEQLAGRAFGELDPADPLNAIVQDIALGKDADGKVRYVTSFVITKPVDMRKASGLMWHDVPNRGRVYGIALYNSPRGEPFESGTLAQGTGFLQDRGFSLLEVVNYMEHYGMLRQKVGEGERQRYERVLPSHSWNSNNIATNVLLYHLQRHSDHHRSEEHTSELQSH